MHPEQMMQRAPHSPMAGTGWLHGWRLTFGGEDIGWEGALATVVEDPDSKVFVVLYDMTPAEDPVPGAPDLLRHHHRSCPGLAIRGGRLGRRRTVSALSGRHG
jgi:hypothetical protein